MSIVVNETNEGAGVSGLPDVERLLYESLPDEQQRTIVLALSRVSAAQAVALKALAAGKPLGEAAAEAGVDRGTLYRWRTHDDQFIAALNAWRSETQTHARDRLLALTDKAIAAVQASIEKGDARLGLRLLKDLNCSRAGRTRPHDPAQLWPNDPNHVGDPLEMEVRKLVKEMTLEQLRRIPQLLADGLALDNQRRKSGEMGKSEQGTANGAR